VKGGTRLFQYQAACPFRAFATLRLDARAPEEPEPGLDAKARGMLLHSALEALWNTLGSHAALCAIAEDTLMEAISAAVHAALEELARDRSQTLTGRFREIEAKRLTRLLRAWLEEEKARAPFKVVAAEQKTTIKLGGLVVEGRMDRVDELKDGTRVILDYKSGKTSTKSWRANARTNRNCRSMPSTCASASRSRRRCSRNCAPGNSHSMASQRAPVSHPR